MKSTTASYLSSRRERVKLTPDGNKSKQKKAKRELRCLLTILLLMLLLCLS